MTSTVTATPTRVIWDMGQGDPVVCDRPGVPYRPDLPDDQQPSDCRYTYLRSGAGQAAQAGGRGVYLGTDELAGGGALCLDVFELYTRGIISAPNVLVVGQVASGKSCAVKTLLYARWGCCAHPVAAPLGGRD